MRSEGNVKPAIRQRELLEKLRGLIVRGKLAPGARLPIRSSLKHRYAVSNDTIQGAFDALIREGFVRSEGSRGTFVSETPPHLCRYALVFASREDGFYWPDWWTIMRQAAATVARAEPPKQIVSYYDITGHADVEDYQRLLADVRAQRLAGIILLVPPYFLRNTPLLDDCPIPRVYIGEGSWEWKVPSVETHLHGFVTRGLEHAAKQSRRRPMLLGPYYKTTWRFWSEACRLHAMEPERRQFLYVPVEPPEAARYVTQNLMMLPPERRPDALIVTDDHLVEEVTSGLLASNLPESELPTVIAYANFPKPPRAHLPVIYLGFDSVAIIRACMDVLETQRRGQSPPPNTLVPAVFASELGSGESGEPGDVGDGASFEKALLRSSYFGAESI